MFIDLCPVEKSSSIWSSNWTSKRTSKRTSKWTSKKVPQNDLEKNIKSIKENPSLPREQLAAIIGKSVKTLGRITKEPKLITFQ